MKRIRMAVIAGLLLAAPAFAAGNAAAGKEAYLKKCVSCHEASGAAKESAARMLKVEIPHLGSKQVQSKDDATLRKAITEGVGKMRPVSGVDGKMSDDIVAFLRTLKAE
jgi:cytochrome c553